MLTCTFEDGGKGSFRHVVVHAIVEKDGKMLLVKRAPGLLEAGKWALPGGFLDRDENAAQAALRELVEETGWAGRDSKLFRINTDPNRPREDRQNVAIVFIITPTEEVGKPDAESTLVAWIPIADLRLDELAFDHGESIGFYLKYRTKAFPLPLFS